MPNTDLHINSDIVNIVNGLNDAVKATDRLGDETKDYQQKSNQAFTSTETNIKEVNQAIKDQEKILKELNRESEKYAKRAKNLSDSEQKAWKRLQGDIKVAGQELDALKGKQAQLANSADNITSKMGGQFKKLAGLIAGVFTVGAIINFTKQSVAAYQEQIRSEAKLRVALQGQDAAIGRIIKQGNELQKVTLFNDEDIINAQGLLAIYVKEEAQIKKLTPLILDFAQAKGMDLASAANIIGKTFGSSTNALTRYGIKVDGIAGSTQRFDDIMEGLTRTVQGQAEGALTDEERALRSASISVNEVKEAWGKMVLAMADVGVFEAVSISLDSITFALDSISKLGLGNFWAGMQKQLWGGSEAFNGLNDQLDRFAEGTRAGAAEIKRRDDLSEKGVRELKDQLIAAADENIKFNEASMGNEATIAYWNAYKEAVMKYTPAIKMATDANGKESESLDSLNAKLKELKETRSAAPLSQTSSFDAEIKALEKQIALYDLKEKKSKKGTLVESKMKAAMELDVELTKVIVDADELQRKLTEELETEDLKFEVAEVTPNEEAWDKLDKWNDAWKALYDDTSKGQIEALNKQQAALDEYFKLGLISQEEYTQRSIELNNQIKESRPFSEQHPFLSSVGFISEDQLNQVKDYVGQITEYANELIAQQVEATQRIVDDQNTRIEEQQQLVNQEFQLKEEGLANNYRVEAESLKKMQIARDAAIKDREKAIRIQRTMSTIEAGVSLVTAAANIMKGFSGIPVVGVILGLAAVAAMIGGFIAAQSKVKEATQMRMGGRLLGPSHAEGGMRIEGSDVEVEGREWVVNARSSEKYNDVLTAINRDDRKGLQIAVNKHNLMKAFPVSTNINIDDSKKLGEIVKLMKSGDGVFMGNGFYIEQRGTMRKTIRLN